MRLVKTPSLFGNCWTIEPGLPGWTTKITFGRYSLKRFELDVGIRVNLGVSSFSDFNFYIEISLFRKRFLYQYYHDITEGRLAESLGVDRLEARRIAQEESDRT